MGRYTKKANVSDKWQGIDLKKLKKELKLIPFDIKREMRFLDLLFSERNIVRTQAEREVLRDLIDRASSAVKLHQNRLTRFQECYDRFKEKKSFDNSILLPEEMQSLRKWHLRPKQEEPCGQEVDLRTGTDG